jgi:hypothetical protein
MMLCFAASFWFGLVWFGLVWFGFLFKKKKVLNECQ